MPRQPRDIEPGTEYHLISRFVDREWFIEKQRERDYYLKLLGRSLEDSDWRLNAFAIMSSHLHLKCVAGDQPLDAWIRRVHSPFADALNRSRDRIGSVFVRGPKAFPVTLESSRYLLAYVHNNPVRAKVCAQAGDTAWTSHRAYIGRADVPRWLHVEEGLARAGFSEPSAFDRWINDPALIETEEQFTEEHYAHIEAMNRDAASAARRDTAREQAELVVTVTAALLGMTLQQVHAKGRGDTQQLVRRVAVRSSKLLQLPGRSIANALQLSATRVSVLQNAPDAANETSLAERVVRELGRAEICNGK